MLDKSIQKTAAKVKVIEGPRIPALIQAILVAILALLSLGETKPVSATGLEPLWHDHGNSGWPVMFEFGPDGKQLLVAAPDRLKTYDAASGAIVDQVTASDLGYIAYGFSLTQVPGQIDGFVSNLGKDKNAGGFDVGYIRFDASQPQNARPVRLFLDPIRDHKASATGRTHLIKRRDDTHVAYYPEQHRLVSLSPPEKGIGAWILTPDDRILFAHASGLYEMSARDGSARQILDFPLGYGPGIATVSVDGQRVAVVGRDRQTRRPCIWIIDLGGTQKPERIDLPEPHSGQVHKIGFLGDGILTLIGRTKTYEETNFKVFMLAKDKDPELLRSFERHLAYAYIAFSPLGDRIAFVAEDGMIDIFGVTHGTTPAPDTPPPPQLVAGLGHGGEIVDIAYSGTGELMATAGLEGTVWVWETATQRAILRFDFPTAGRRQRMITFSADGRFLYGSDGQSVHKISLSARKPVRKFKLSGAEPHDQTFGKLREGRGFYSCNFYRCTSFSVSDESVARMTAKFHPGYRSIADCSGFMVGYDGGGFSFDPKESKLRIVDADGQAPGRDIPFPQELAEVFCGPDDTILAIAPDGRVLSLASDGSILADRMFVNTVAEILLLPSGDAAIAASGIIDTAPAKIYRVDGRTLEIRDEVHIGGRAGWDDVLSVSTLVLAPGGAEVMAGFHSYGSVPAVLKRLSVPDLALSDGPAAAVRPVEYLSFDAEGDRLLINMRDTLTIWDLETGQAAPVRDAAPFGRPRFSGRDLVFATGDGHLNRLEPGGVPQAFTQPPVQPEGFWTDGTVTMSGATTVMGYDAGGGASGGALVWQDGKPVLVRFEADYSASPPELSPDGRRMALEGLLSLRYDGERYSSTSAVDLYDLTSRPPRRIWRSVSDDWPAEAHSSSPFGPGFTADARHIVLSGSGGNLDTGGAVVLDASDGRATAHFPNAVPVHVAGSGTNTAMLLHLDTATKGRLERVMDDPAPSAVPLNDVFPNVAVASSGGRALLLSDARGAVLLWRRQDGATVALDAQVPGAEKVAFSEDGRLLALAETDGSVSLWRVETAELIARLILLRNGDWAVVGRDGRYDAADPGNVAGLSWILPDDPTRPEPVETYFLDYYEPRLLNRLIMAEAFPPLPSPSERNRVTPHIEIAGVETDGPPKDGVARATVTVLATERARDGQKSGLGDVKLFRDGQLVAVARDLRPGVDGSAMVRFENIRLPADRPLAELTAYGFNGDGIKSETAAFRHRVSDSAATVPRRAYVIGVGVNSYDNSAWDLKYAAADAEASVALVADGLKQSGAFETVHALPLLSGDASGARLARRDLVEAVLRHIGGTPRQAPAPEEIETLLAELPPARPQDLVYLTFAGHGLATSNGQFHFFTQEFGAGTTGRSVAPDALAQSLSSDRLADLLMNIDVRDMMLVVDACNSAASVESDGFKPGPMGSRGLGQLAYDKSMRVIAASQSEALALESDRLQHGVLSFAMLREGLEAGQADREPRDGTVNFAEMFGFAVTRVPDLYGELRNGSFKPVSRGNFSLSDDADASALTAQRPAYFDFRARKDAEIELTITP